MDILRDYAMQWVGTPYIWGGQSFGGVDCSGLLQILLASVGEDPKLDQTAQALYNHFEGGVHALWNKYGTGSLVFFGKSATKVTHCGMLLDQYRIVHAAGGGSWCDTVDKANRAQAYVKVELLQDVIDNRRDPFVAVLKPHYKRIGQL